MGDRVTQKSTDPIVMSNKIASDAWDKAYQDALAQGKSDAVAQFAGGRAYKIAKANNTPQTAPVNGVYTLKI